VDARQDMKFAGLINKWLSLNFSLSGAHTYTQEASAQIIKNNYPTVAVRRCLLSKAARLRKIIFARSLSFGERRNLLVLCFFSVATTPPALLSAGRNIQGRCVGRNSQKSDKSVNLSSFSLLAEIDCNCERVLSVVFILCGTLASSSAILAAHYALLQTAAATFCSPCGIIMILDWPASKCIYSASALCTRSASQRGK